MLQKKTNQLSGSLTEISGLLEDYCNLLEAQVDGIREEMKAVVSTISDGIERIRATAEKKKKEADTILVKTYTDPDRATKDAMNTIQHSVDSVFEQASAAMANNINYPESRDDASQPPLQNLSEAKKRRSGGQFSKHMEALSTLDGEVRDLLLSMLDALSKDEVIGERLEHVASGVAALGKFIRTELKHAPKAPARVTDKFKNDFLAAVFRKYTSDGERRIFQKHFGSPRKKARSA